MIHRTVKIPEGKYCVDFTDKKSQGCRFCSYQDRTYFCLIDSTELKDEIRRGRTALVFKNSKCAKLKKGAQNDNQNKNQTGSDSHRVSATTRTQEITIETKEEKDGETQVTEEENIIDETHREQEFEQALFEEEASEEKDVAIEKEN